MSFRIIQSEKLIECVRKHEELYNMNMKEYSDSQHKIKLWNKIAKECYFSTGTETKRMWKNLRDGYRCALKTVKLAQSKDATKKIKQWKFFDQMDFLRAHMKDRVRSASLTGDDENDSLIGEDVDDIVLKNVSNEFRDTALLYATSQGSSNNQDQEYDISKKRSIFNERDDEPTAKKRAEKSSQDSLKLFFDTMYATTKELPKASQRYIKRKIFEVVAAVEDSVDTSIWAMQTLVKSPTSSTEEYASQYEKDCNEEKTLPIFNLNT